MEQRRTVTLEEEAIELLQEILETEDLEATKQEIYVYLKSIGEIPEGYKPPWENTDKLYKTKFNPEKKQVTSVYNSVWIRYNNKPKQVNLLDKTSYLHEMNIVNINPNDLQKLQDFDGSYNEQFNPFTTEDCKPIKKFKKATTKKSESDDIADVKEEKTIAEDRLYQQIQNSRQMGKSFLTRRDIDKTWNDLNLGKPVSLVEEDYKESKE